MTLDDESPISMADRADEIGRSLSRLFAAGARGVAIGFLLPAKWSASPHFADLLLRHPEDLTLAIFSEPDGHLVGAECMDELTTVALGPRRASEIFGFVNLTEDRDDAVRRGRLRFRDRSGNGRDSWAVRAARGLGPDLNRENGMPHAFWIDTRIDWPSYEQIAWRQVPAALAENPGLFRGRLVLVGGGSLRGSGDDYYRVPHRSGRSRAVSGLTLQALMVDTIAAGLPVREAGRNPVLAAATVGTALAMALILCARRVLRTTIWLATGTLSYLALSFPVFWWAGLMLPVTAPLLLVLLGAITALAMRRVLPAPPEVSAP